MIVKRVFWMLVLILGWSLPAQAQPDWQQIHGYLASEPALAESNGQKLVTGVGNVLHLVWANGGRIEYSQSSDGLSWTGPTTLACGLTGRLPAIAADTSGKLVVVWVDDSTGSIQYVFHDGSDTGTWSMPETIVADGDEPSIVARRGKAYLAWRPTGADRIEYAKFAIGPSPTLDVETIELANCPEDQYRLPSIALVAASDPCADPVPVVAYSFSRTEKCIPAGSIIGPRVCRRDNNLGTWSLSWDGSTLDTTTTSVEPISISLASRYRTRELFLAYSRVQGGDTRTAMAHADHWAWSGPEPIDGQERHIHVRANEANSSPLGTFRVARSPRGPYGAEYRDGVWTAGSPTWTTSWQGDLPVGRPHATWWQECVDESLRNLYFAAEEDLVVGSGGTHVGVAATLEQPCPPAGLLIAYKQPCKTHVVRVAGFAPPDGPQVTLVDVTEAGNVLSFNDKGAVVTTLTGSKIDIAWGPGKVVSSSESTLTITAAPESVRFSSPTERISVESLGVLKGFDRAPGGELCPVR
jgi:hypothetical protein